MLYPTFNSACSNTAPFRATVAESPQRYSDSFLCLTTRAKAISELVHGDRVVSPACIESFTIIELGVLTNSKHSLRSIIYKYVAMHIFMTVTSGKEPLA